MDLLVLARDAAGAAADYLRSVAPPDPSRWTMKAQHDYVTDLDRRAEQIIRERLLAGTPAATIVGEELSPDDVPGRGLAWIVDPLDGTANFVHRYPACAVSIAAAVDGVLHAGVVARLEPAVEIHAVRGGGAWMHGARLKVSAITEPAHALIGTGFPFKHPALLAAYMGQFARVMAGTSGIRRAGSAALDLADVAAGRFDGFWELFLAPWDIAAGILLVREAGGVVTGLEGLERGLSPGPVVAGNPAVHAWLVGELGRQ